MNEFFNILFKNKGCTFFFCSKPVTDFVVTDYTNGKKVVRKDKVPTCNKHGRFLLKLIKDLGGETK